MNALEEYSKEIILYSIILLSGTVLIFNNLFPKKKINKKFYDKNKKKLIILTKHFFDDLTKDVEVVKFQNELSNNRLYKLKKFVEKLTSESLLINTSSENSLKKASTCKKDQIFFLLLNNMSSIIIKTSNDSKDIK